MRGKPWNSIRKKEPDVHSLWPNPWLLIALHSPTVTELWLLTDSFEYKTANVLQNASQLLRATV
jgi:hypothetical protein